MMTSTVSEGAPSFLDHIHCSVCHRTLVSSASDTIAENRTQSVIEGPFWIGECFHIFCHREINGGQAHDHQPLPRELRAICPKCHIDVYAMQLQPNELPAPLQRYLQPFDASIGELTDAYNFQFKHMSDLISYLKSKVLEQKRLLSLLKNDFDRYAVLQRELAAVRKENLALKADVQALRSRPLKVEADITCNESPSHRPCNTEAAADRAHLRPPSRCLSGNFQQPELRSRPLTQTSTGGSEIFAFKPPPLPFRAISPKTFMARASIRDSPRMQPGSLPSSHSHLRTPSNPQERFKRVPQSPLQRHVAHGTHSYQYAQPSSRTAVSLFQSPRSTPSLARTEDQPPQRAQTHSWHSAAAAGPTQQ